ncbi:MFS transporter [Bacillus sp. T3]|uniref:MFS transporter n=1 Tax=Bacillus sp. T3 TaxID=467262 RepID=UPI002981155D|nr:MFS transporter [Bacillus sp. T3]
MKEIRKLEKPMLFLLLGVLLAHLGIYLVTPLLPIVLRTAGGLSIVQIGTVLATIAISFQTGSIMGGFLADRIGRRFMIGLGAFVGGVGYSGFALFNSYWSFLFAAIIFGIGNGVYAPSTKAAIAALASKENQTTAFSLRGIAANIGIVLAGLIVFFFLSGTSKTIFWIAAMIYFVLALESWLLVPKSCGNEPCPETPSGAIKEVFKNKPFLVFGAVGIFIWALYAQFSLALPLRAAEILPDPKNVSLIWTINSCIVIFLQGAVTTWIIKRLHPLTAMALGIGLIGFGIGSLYWANEFTHLVFSGAIFIVGEMLIMPTMDSTVSQLSRADLIGIFFALANVVSGLGEAGGKFVGGNLLEMGTRIKYLPWAVFSIGGLLLTFTIVFVLKRWKPLEIALHDAATKPNSPKQAPKVNSGPIQHPSHPFSNWEPEVFLRKRRNT